MNDFLYQHKELRVKLPTYKAGHLKIIAQEGDCIPFLAPSLLAFIPVHRTGHTADFRQLPSKYHPELTKQEMLWRFMRYEETTTNTYYESFEELRSAVFKRS